MLAFCATAFPMAARAHKDGADPFKTGGLFPGESVCTECHNNGSINRPNQGPGSVTFSVSPYRPNEKQVITVTVSDPTQTQMRWGFEITARVASSLLTGAGAFSCSVNPRTSQCETADGNAQVICDDPIKFPSPPCPAGKPQFATHTLTGTRRGTRNRVSFQVEWTAPATDVGKIIFAAAGNAANGSDTEFGDNIYISQMEIVAATGGGPVPTITEGGIVGAGLSNPTVKQISANGLISIFGQDFAPAGTARGVTGADLVDSKLPTNLAGVCVLVGGQAASMFFVSPGQINVQVPTLAGTGSMAVQVLANCGAANQSTSNTSSVTVQAGSPEFFFFKLNADGKNPIAATNALTGAPLGAADLFPGTTTPAKPDSFVTLYATGFGATDPPVQAGVLPAGIARTVGKVTVTVNGVTLADPDVLYAGVAPGFAGLYQINVHLPASLPDGDLPVTASLGGISTPAGAFITVKK